jgi:hypothetical protein
MCAEFVDDCLYMLIQPTEASHCLSGWVDRTRFLERKKLNPVPITAGKAECWGVHWTQLEPLNQLPEPDQINFAVLSAKTNITTLPGFELWYGHSAVDGWVVINWRDPRNMPGRSPRYLYLLRGHDDTEVRIRFSDWLSPAFLDAREYLTARCELEQLSLSGQLASLQSRIEGPS